MLQQCYGKSIIMDKNCLNCGKTLAGKNTKQYCSSGCKQEAYRQRKGVDRPNFLNPTVKTTVKEPKPIQPIEAKPVPVAEQAERDNRFIVVSQSIVELNSKIYRLQFQKENLLKKIAALEDARSVLGDVNDGITAGVDWGNSLRDTFGNDGAGKLGVALGVLAGLHRMHNTDHDDINRRNRHKARTLRGELREVDSEINDLTAKRIYFETGLNQLKREIKQELTAIVPAPMLNRELPGAANVPVATPQIVRRDDARVISLTQLKAQKFDVYEFTGGFEEIIGNPDKDFSMVVYGESGQGKSTWVIEFANYLAEHHGRVLYNSSEERISQSLKRKLLKYDSDNFAIAECQSYKALKTAVRGNGFKFVVIDSVNDMDIKPNQLNELTEMNPDKAFIFILQATKQGAYKGSSQIAHDADVLIRLENYQPIVEKTRFK